MKSGQKIINIMNEIWAPFTRKSCSGQGASRGDARKTRPSVLGTTPIVSGSMSKPSNRSPGTDAVHQCARATRQRVPIRSHPAVLPSGCPHRLSAGTLSQVALFIGATTRA